MQNLLGYVNVSSNEVLTWHVVRFNVSSNEVLTWHVVRFTALHPLNLRSRCALHQWSTPKPDAIGLKKLGAGWLRTVFGWLFCFLHSSVQPWFGKLPSAALGYSRKKILMLLCCRPCKKNVLPSQAAAAYENVRPSIVRVVSFVKKSRLEDMKASKHAKNQSVGKKPPYQDKSAKKPGANDDNAAKSERSARLAPDLAAEEDEVELGVGTGVVIVDKGIILTNWHVVQGADRIKVTFMDGLEAEADIKGVQAEDDLAVLQARKIPDDLIAATMRSTNDLAPGDQVIAVGFPFGIGPSTSAGVVSGLKRSFKSPEGGQTMKNLIQFDAAANPGNSGGPLVTMDGEVVGIVTAIMNPTPARTFIGIGFAVPIENAAAAAGMPPF